MINYLHKSIILNNIQLHFPLISFKLTKTEFQTDCKHDSFLLSIHRVFFQRRTQKAKEPLGTTNKGSQSFDASTGGRMPSPCRLCAAEWSNFKAWQLSVCRAQSNRRSELKWGFPPAAPTYLWQAASPKVAALWQRKQTAKRYLFSLWVFLYERKKRQRKKAR